MKDIFSSEYMKCDKCQYVGKFLNEKNINDSKWKNHFNDQLFNHSDYACPKCSHSTTKADQIDYHEITEIAYNANHREK